jgi:hypothetical protein
LLPGLYVSGCLPDALLDFDVETSVLIALADQHESAAFYTRLALLCDAVCRAAILAARV